MGIINKPSVLYLNVSCGKLVNKKEGIEGSRFIGYLEEILMSEENFEGNPVEKAVLVFRDSDPESKYPRVYIKFNLDSAATSGILKRLGQVDLSQPVELVVMKSDLNEKISFLTLIQNGRSVPVDETLPTKGKKIKGKILDYTDVKNAFWEVARKTGLYRGGTDRKTENTPEEQW